jgi:hypothetical protein
MIVFIDSGVLGLLGNPNSLLSQGVYICSSEICDFEVRRSLVLASQKNTEINSIQNLDELREIIDFLPISSALLKQAAYLWASARSQGIPTADDKSLDADMIICTQWQMLKAEFPGRYIVIATTNVKHLSRFSESKVWRDINF